MEYTEGIIRKEGNKYIIYSHDGKKKLGEYSSHKEAVKRLQEIEYFKHKGNGNFKDYLLDAFDKVYNTK